MLKCESFTPIASSFWRWSESPLMSRYAWLCGDARRDADIHQHDGGTYRTRHSDEGQNLLQFRVMHVYVGMLEEMLICISMTSE